MNDNLIPKMFDSNDTPYDRYLVAILDGKKIVAISSYFYFYEDAVEEYEVLLEVNGVENTLFILNEVGEILSKSFKESFDVRKKFGSLPIPEDRKWDIRDFCFPAVLFPEKGA